MDIIGYKALKIDNDGNYYTNGNDYGNKIIWKKGTRIKIKNDLKLCKNGIHFFKHLCFAVNYFYTNNPVAKVKIYGEIIEDTHKCCTNDLEIITILSKKEIKKQLDKNNNSGDYNSGNSNSGDYNSGNCNSGDCNSGDCNSGDYNSGRRNSGNYNSGRRNSGRRNSGNYNPGNNNSGNYNPGNSNSGDYNSGNCNSGDCNSGDCNSGDYNSGNYNSGNYNSGNYNSGNGYKNFFCTKERFFIFDIEVESIPKELKNLNMSWFNLKNKTYKEAWKNCPENILNIIKTIPNFNKEKFFEITGIKI